jgi:outer membrane receptor protein involved in Fe transport
MRVSLGGWQSDDALDGLLQDYQGAIEAPLIDEWLSTRLAFRYLTRDPYMVNGCAGGFENESDRFPENPTNFFPNGPSFCGEMQHRPVDNPDRQPGEPNKVGISQLPSGLPRKLNDAADWAARGTLRFQPPALEMDWLLMARGERLSQLSTMGQAMGTGSAANGSLGTKTSSGYQEPDNLEMQEAARADGTPSDVAKQQVAQELSENLDIRPYRIDVNRVGMTTRDSWAVSLRGDWNIDASNATSLKLESVSGYDWYERFRETDNDYTPDVLFEAVNEDTAWQFFQSLTLGGELADEPVRWEVGGTFLREQLDLVQVNDVTGGAGALKTFRDYTQDVWSANGWLQGSWDFLDDFTLEGGVRYNWEQRDIAVNFHQDGGSPNPTGNSQVFSAPTGTLLLRYRFSEAMSVYWKYNRGWKSGTYNANTSLSNLDTGITPWARPEVIDAFELGLRGHWLDGRLSAGGALFYYGYEDYQVFRVGSTFQEPPEIVVVNAGEAEVYGAELDIRAEPLAGWAPGWLDGLVLTGRFGWLETQFLEFSDLKINLKNIGDVQVPVPIQINYGGNPLINSPRFKFSLSTEWTFDMGRWGSLTPRYDFTWSDTIYFDPNEGQGVPADDRTFALPKGTIGMRPFWLHNLRFGYRAPTGNVELAVWVRNLTDVAYKNYAFDATGFQQVTLYFLGQPRSVGVDLSVDF